MRSAAILAGGRATRFDGRDKSALVVHDRTILDRQIAALALVPHLAETLIVGGRSERAAHRSVRFVADLVPGCGPLGGLHAALSDACTDLVFVVACDMPYITAPFVEHLFAQADGVDAVVPRTDRDHPLCAVYRRTCLAPIARRLADGQLAVRALFEDVRTRMVPADDLDRFGDRHRLLANVNTPVDLAALHGHEL